jgi:hypothetical protein
MSVEALQAAPDPLEDPRRIFRELRGLLDGSDGVGPELRAEALSLLDAILEPSEAHGHDLPSALAFLIHCLEGGRWRMGQFFRVLDAHEFLLNAITIIKEPSDGK